MNKTIKRLIGDEFEQQAADYLCQQGLKLIQRNYHCRLGEIDLVMRMEHTLVFVEVRYRTSESHGGAIASITPDKQRKLKRSAQCYLLQKGLNEHQQLCRFDIIAFAGDAKATPCWIQNAF